MYIIDRFEGDLAVIETDNGYITANKKDLPENVREGTALMLCGDSFIIDDKTTLERKQKINKLQDDLFT